MTLLKVFIALVVLASTSLADVQKNKKELTFPENVKQIKIHSTSMKKDIDTIVVLPESYEGKPVTAIGDRAFADAGLDAIAFSTTIKSVGNKAFAGHSNLKIYFEGKSEDWLRGVKKDPGWRIDCDFSVIYPTDPSWEVDITG